MMFHLLKIRGLAQIIPRKFQKIEEQAKYLIKFYLAQFYIEI
jgi:hypothetical protein